MRPLRKWIFNSILFLSLTVTAFTCEDKHIDEPIDDPNINQSACKKMITNNLDVERSSDSFDFVGIKVEENCLKISVRYGGGCKEVDFQLYQVSAIMKSHPPQTILFLKLIDDDDCEALLTKELLFDINSVKLPYNTGTIIFNIDGYPEAIEYTY